MAIRVPSLAWREGSTIVLPCVGSARRPEWPGLLKQEGVCLAQVHDLHQNVQGATVQAEGDRECRGLPRVPLYLSLSDAAAAPPDVMHRQEAAGQVSSMFTTRSVLTPHGAHEPAQLDEQPVRVGVLLLRTVELFHALGGLLVAQMHATPWLSGPTTRPGRTSSPCGLSHSCARLLIVTALRPKTSETRMMCSLSRVMSSDESKIFLQSGAARGALRFQRCWSVIGLILVEHPWSTSAGPQHEAPLHVPPPLCPPLVGDMSRNQSRTVGSTWTSGALRTAAVGRRLQRVAGLAGAVVVAQGVLT